MADFYSVEAAAPAKPTVKRNASDVQSAMMRSIATFNLASQAIASRLMLPTVPKGAKGVHHRYTASVSLGSATIAHGVAGNISKYRAAAVFTAVDTPTAVALAANLAAANLTANEDQFLTVAAAALPASGTLTVETFYSMP